MNSFVSQFELWISVDTNFKHTDANNFQITVVWCLIRWNKHGDGKKSLFFKGHVNHLVTSIFTNEHENPKKPIKLSSYSTTWHYVYNSAFIKQMDIQDFQNEHHLRVQMVCYEKSITSNWCTVKRTWQIWTIMCYCAAYPKCGNFKII